MIELYTGVNGSGKSYHSVQTIIETLEAGKDVICTFRVNLEGLKHLRGRLHYRPDLTVVDLYNYAHHAHDLHDTKHTGAQTLVVMDEVYNWFDPRDWQRDDRELWVNFLKVSRHYRYDFVFICQDDQVDLDKKIRGLVDYSVIHRSLEKTFIPLKIWCLLTGRPWFFWARHYYQRGAVRGKVDSGFLALRKKYAKRYNTLEVFDHSLFEREMRKYIERHGNDEHAA